MDTTRKPTFTPGPCPDCKPSVAKSEFFKFGSVVKNAPCGCEVSGTGNLPDPWHIHYCPQHAAAPALYEACKVLLADMEAEYRDRHGDADHDGMEQARKALAQAEGR